jgi:uncharacterized cupin superfamily protein
MVPEAEFEDTGTGRIRTTPGWFVLNARDARWQPAKGRGAYCLFDAGKLEFEQTGVHLVTLAPGDAMGMYHWEVNQEDFLVVAGEALLIVEGEERPLKQWDFVHCPPGTEHIILGAGDGPCLVVAIGARDPATEENWGRYTVDEAALRHGASVEEETTSGDVAYAKVEPRRPATFEEGGWLPE